MSKNVPGILGIYAHMDDLIEGIKHFKGEGRNNIKVYTPTPRHEIDNVLKEKVSPVRWFTLIGGLTGCTFGYLFTAYTSLDWILPTSGKPVVSPVAYTVIAFEMTILFGSIFTLLGIILNAKLFRKRPTLYDDRFTEDRFGIFVPCASSDHDRVSKAMREQGAEEVKRAE